MQNAWEVLFPCPIAFKAEKLFDLLTILKYVRTC